MIFERITGFIKDAVGNNLPNDPDDIRTVRKNIREVSKPKSLDIAFENDEDDDIPFITRNLEDRIKIFQQNKGLKVDGKLFPGGETERTLFETLEGMSSDLVFGKEDNDGSKEHVGFGGNIFGTLNLGKKSRPSIFAGQKPPFVLEERNDTSPFLRSAVETPEPPRKPEMLEAAEEPEELKTDTTGRPLRMEDITPAPKPEKKPLDSPFRPPILEGMDNKEVKARVKREEGDVTFLYKDTSKAENITVGAGIMLPNVEEAKKLPFTIADPSAPDGKRPATDEEIERAFNKVRAKPHGPEKKHIHFTPEKTTELDRLELSKPQIDRILDERLRSDSRKLRQKFPEFDTYPPEAQHALLDMQFNLGNSAFQEGNWPGLFGAVKAGNWKEAARESNRLGVGDGRNKRTREAFEKAHEQSISR